MFTAIVTGIILFPWFLVLVPFVGWLVRRARGTGSGDARAREDFRKAA
jgi:hypothetical protein